MKDISELDLKLAKYKIDKLTLNIEGYGEYDVNPLYAGSILMEKDYDNYEFPFFEIMVALPNKVFRAMKKSNIKIYCYVRMKYAYFKQDDNTGGTESIVSPKEKLLFAKNFYVYGVEGTPDLTEEFAEKLEEALKITDKNADLNNMTTTYLLLYDDKKLQQATKIVNEVITDCTLTDAITRVLNVIGMNKVLMSPEESGKLYHEFTLLPIRADEQLEHICNDLHMHSTGTRIFFDIDYNYIVSKSLTCDAWRPGEYKKTYVIYDPPIEGAKRTQGCCEDADDECNYCTMCDFTLSTASYMTEQAYGTAFTSIDSKTGKITDLNSDVDTVGGGRPTPSRVIFNNSGEVGTADQMITNLENTSAVWEVIIDSMVIDMLSPNKEFELVFLSNKLSKYNGPYKIARFITNFNKTDGMWFTTTTRAQFAGKKKA